VVSDRFADSTMAYQGYGLGLEIDVIDALYFQVAGDFAPELALILDLPVAEGLARAGKRDRALANATDRYERMGEAFHERLRAGFLEIARANARRCVVIEASGDVAATAALVREAVERRFRVKLR
jgi:dTMP kinase